MELRQLAYFVAVADQGSFTKASLKLRVAQPGISAQIRLLEGELGIELFDRTRRHIRLTEAGRDMLDHARSALAAADGMRWMAQDMKALIRGHLAIGAVVACDSLDLSELIARFHHRYPAIEVALSEGNSDRLAEGLVSATLDVAFLAVLPDMPPQLSVHIVANEPIALLVRPDDPLAKEGALPIEALNDRALITLPRGTGIRSWLDVACAQVGFEPYIAFEGSNPNLLVRLALRGLGPLVLPRSMAGAHADDLACVAIRATSALQGQLGLAWRSEGPQSPASKAFVHEARRFWAEST